MSSTIHLAYFNGTALVQRELLQSQDCPKCLSLERVSLADVAYTVPPNNATAPALWASVRVPVRCSLCETEYARRDDSKPLLVTLDETEKACEQAKWELRRAMPGAVVTSENDPDCPPGYAWNANDVAGFKLKPLGKPLYGGDYGEAMRIMALDRALDEHEAWAANRTWREKLRDAWRGWWAGWRHGV